MKYMPGNLLAIEASGQALSVALFENGRLAKDVSLSEKRLRHSETLLPAVDGLLKETGLSVGDIEAFAVTRGPGSFTSVRIALATALGLAYPEKRPVYALNTLEVLAAGIEPSAESAGPPLGERPLRLPMLDARKGEVYAALYGDDLAAEVLLRPGVGKVADWIERALEFGRPLLVFGEGARTYRQALENASERIRTLANDDSRPLARHLGRRVLQRLEAGLPCEPVAPLYLRKPEAVVHLQGKGSR